MKSLRNVFGTLGILSLMLTTTTGGLDAQQIVTDTIIVTVEGLPTQALITAAYASPVHVNDSIIFRVEVTDENGAPLDALVTFITADSTALQLGAPSNPQPGRYEVTGVALKVQDLLVWAVVDPILEVRIASFRDGVLNWTGSDTIAVGDSLQYCAWALRGTSLVVESPGPPNCPTVWTPSPTAPHTAVPDHLRPHATAMYGLVRRRMPLFDLNGWQRSRVFLADRS